MMVRKILLGCGIVSSVLYVVTDILGSLRYPGYSYADQEFSELTAQGAPTRDFMLALNVIPYTVLMAALVVGIWRSAGPKKRAARITAAMLGGYQVVGFVAGVLTPMTTRGADDTFRNTLHGPLTLVSSLFFVAAMGFAATLLGKRFRYYSYGTIIVLVVAGIVTSLQIPRLAANEPTPWMGIEERINIYALMLWTAVLAVGLLRAQGTVAPCHLEKPTVSSQPLAR